VIAVTEARGGPEVEGWREVDGELYDLDERLETIERWIHIAAGALLSFRSGPGFQQSSASSARERGATSTARSFFALHEYRRFLIEQSNPHDLRPEVDGALKELLRGWAFSADLRRGPKGIRSFDSRGQANLFTDSHILTSLVLVKNLASELGLDSEHRAAATRIRRACSSLNKGLLKQMREHGEVGVRVDEPGHHFVTFHAVRAVDSFGGMEGGLGADEMGPLALEAENRALQQLAYRAAKVMARFDPARLAFAATLLRRLKVADWRQLSEHSIQVVVEGQTEDGAWPTSQLVTYQSKSMLHVSSYELGLALACLALRELAHGELDLVRTVLPSLDRVMDLVRAGYVANQDHGLEGWANDRTRWEGLVESWATAIVLTLLLRYRDVVLEFRQQLVLRRYGATLPPHFEAPWPDLAGALFPVRKLDTTALESYSDPTPRRRLVRALQRNVLEPVVSEVAQRPEKASMILYGPPGSRKSSLVKATAEALSWPLVTLSPPDFLGDGGLEGFEVSAARIFEDLMRLRRAVVLFDECEDFFKPRPSDEDGDEDRDAQGDGPIQDDAGTRTIGAFLTAGMLPRLQALRDRRWVIFVLATNSKLAALDKAVRRPGRFDFAECLEHPVLSAQERYVLNHRRRMDSRQRKALGAALAQVAPSRRKGKNVPFAVIDHVVNTIRDENLVGSKVEVLALLEERLANIDEPPSLTRKSVARRR
jgi:hypothetical protein